MYIFIILAVGSAILTIWGSIEGKKSRTAFNEDARKSSDIMLRRIKKGEILEHLITNGASKVDEGEEAKKFCDFITTANFCNIMKNVKDIMYHG